MTHLDEETLQRAVDGELDAAAAPAVRQHLAGCPECARRVEEAGREQRRAFALLEALDHPVPALDPDAIVARRRAPRPRPLAAAAVAVLVVAAGLAWALPGSPVRSWIRSARTGGGPEAVAPVEPASAGISVVPGDSLDVVFEAPQHAGAVRVAPSASGELHLRVEGEPPAIAVEPHRVRVANAGSSAGYRIEIPPAAPLVRVLVGDRPILVQRGASLRMATPPDSAGAIVLPLR